MPPLTNPAVVLRVVNYRDHDRMLTLLSPRLGRVDVLSRGCRRPRSALMPASELFVAGEFVLFQSSERATLTSCAVQDTFYPLRLEPYRLTCASYMAGLCAAAAQPAQPAEELYALLLKGLYYLAYDDGADALDTTAAFALAFADATGYRPRLSRCAHCRKPLELEHGAPFDVEAGGLCCREHATPAAYPLTKEQIVWMSQALREGFTAQRGSGAGKLFTMLRRYAEARLETTVKAGRLLP